MHGGTRNLHFLLVTLRKLRARAAGIFAQSELLDPSVGATVPACPAFNGFRQVQVLVVSPSTPAQLPTFAAEHFCHLWAPIIAAEPQQ